MWSFHEVHLLKAFPQSDWERHTSTPYPRFYRGLPRVFLKSRPTLSRVVSPYDHVPTLLRTLALKAIAPLYLPDRVQRQHRLYCEMQAAIPVLSPQFPSVDFIATSQDAPLNLRAVPLGLHFLQWGLIQTGPPFEFTSDLLALAENRLTRYPLTRRFIRLAWEEKLHGVAPVEAEWVEEWMLQLEEMRPIEAIREEMGAIRSHPDLEEGFQELSRILQAEFSAVSLLKGLVARALLHVERPTLAALETDLLNRFIAGKIPFSILMISLRSAI